MHNCNRKLSCHMEPPQTNNLSCIVNQRIGYRCICLVKKLQASLSFGSTKHSTEYIQYSTVQYSKSRRFPLIIIIKVIDIADLPSACLGGQSYLKVGRYPPLSVGVVSSLRTASERLDLPTCRLIHFVSCPRTWGWLVILPDLEVVWTLGSLVLLYIGDRRGRSRLRLLMGRDDPILVENSYLAQP